MLDIRNSLVPLLYTTLLLELARTLLERAEQDEWLRMPIVFHLSSWAEKRQALRTWLVEELRTKYQVPRKIGQSWIDADQVLPLLDGLDEVAKEARTACVEQINDYYQSRLECGSSPVVICCRREEYTALSTPVILQHAVSILPLTDEQINTYLEQAGEQVQALRQAVNEDAELHSLARQPLMLNIFTFAYQRATVAEIPVGETREEMQHSVFARYVEHMLKRRGRSRRWELEQVVRWLAFLAGQMRQDDQTVFAVENLQPTWLPKKWRILYSWCLGLVIGLVCELIIGLPFGLFYGLAPDPVVEQTVKLALEPTLGGALKVLAGPSIHRLLVCLMIVLGSGPCIGLFVGIGFGETGVNLIEVLTWSWKKALSGLMMGLGVGLAFGLIISLTYGLMAWLFGVLVVGLPFLLSFGLVVGLVIGLVLGSISGLGVGLSGRPLPERLTFSPNESIWRSGKNGLVVGLVFGQVVVPVVGLVVWLVVGLAIGSATGLAIAIAVGMGTGFFVVLFLGLRSGLDAFVKHFVLRFLLWRRGNLPWDLVPFLEEAAERLLLRKVGGSHVFAHHLLLEYFADLAEENE